MAAASANLRALAPIGHRLASSAGSVGARHLSEGCRELERRALAGDRAGALALVGELTARFNALLRRIEREFP
jgi:HPt (histidine-containing phosphotransfer) domain-containing protein